MSAKIATIEVRILDRVFPIKCPDDKVFELQQSAEYLDKKMRVVQSDNKFTSLDKIAVITALNLANEALANANKANALAEKIASTLQLQNCEK
jgi:cell division protein ZapA